MRKIIYAKGKACKVTCVEDVKMILSEVTANDHSMGLFE